jgi:prevent-host-death family protein
MGDKTVSIGEVKRDISELVNRVAYGHERIILTSRGKPKAVLVSVEDYQHLQEQGRSAGHQQWTDWLRRADELSRRILQERGGQPLDVNLVVKASKEELEARHDDLFPS